MRSGDPTPGVLAGAVCWLKPASWLLVLLASLAISPGWLAFSTTMAAAESRWSGPGAHGAGRPAWGARSRGGFGPWRQSFGPRLGPAGLPGRPGAIGPGGRFGSLGGPERWNGRF